MTVPEPAVTFTSISVGYSHSLALGSNGKTYAWGANFSGQLGNGTNTDSDVPVLVQAPAGVTFTSISAGSSHSLALGSDGNTYAWGYNWYGQLGNGTNTDSDVPVLVQAPAGVTF
ncbi:MAG: chromosome condensation regulator RCC1, partial [Aurantimicrobium sp.]